MSKLAKRYQLELNAVDSDGNGIKFETADAERYLELKSAVSRTLTETCKSLVEIEEKKYFLMDGYMSMKEFVSDAFNFSYMTATKYMLVEKTFGEIGIDYNKFPITKLIEISKDEDKMKVLKRVKDPEAKVIDYVQELKEKKVSDDLQKKNQKNSDKGSLVNIPLQQFRENMKMFGLTIQNTSFDWNDDENLNEIGKILETWKEITDSIDGLFLANIDRVRTERKAQEEERRKSEEEHEEIMKEVRETNGWDEREAKKKRRKKNEPENTESFSEETPVQEESAETGFEGHSEE